ncbi:hypothetical protein GPALN_006518 [Globodera pallida]|nr:hypothetical protein GPALN_006518 [Globodera pallida]
MAQQQLTSTSISCGTTTSNASSPLLASTRQLWRQLQWHNTDSSPNTTNRITGGGDNCGGMTFVELKMGEKRLADEDGRKGTQRRGSEESDREDDALLGLATLLFRPVQCH